METSEFSPSSRMYPNLKQSFGLLGIFIVLQIVVSIVFLFLGMLLFDSYDISILFFVVYILSFVLTLWFAIYKRKLSPKEEKFYFNKIPNVAYPILILLTLAVLILLDPLISLIPIPDSFKKILEDMMSGQSPWVIILMVIGAPILEEMLFRGIILDGFLHHYSPQKAIIWSSILFGLVHLNPWQFVAAFTGGLLIGWVYWQTRSLLPAMFIHFVMNFSSFLLQFILVGDDQMFMTFESIGGVWVFIFLMIISIAVLKFGLPILKQILSPRNKIDEFKIPEPLVEITEESDLLEETEEDRNARKRKGCLRILLIGVGVVLLSIMICTVGMKMLLKDSLSETVKQEIIQITHFDDQLKDKFIIDNVSGNQMYVKLDLEFLQKPESIDDVKKWTRYVCEQCKEVLKNQEMTIGSINVTGMERLPEPGQYIFGVMSYNGFSHAYNFFEMNEVR
jgi:uncharacterized protein